MQFPVADFLNALPVAALLVTRSGEIVVANRAASHLLEISYCPSGGKFLTDIFVEPTERIERYLRFCSRSGQILIETVTSRQHREWRLEGARFKLSQHIDSGPLIFLRVILKSKTGSGFVHLNNKLELFSRQIKHSQELQQALSASEEQFRTLVNSIPQLAWMADPNGYIFWYNSRWYEYTGTTLEEMEGWGWKSVHDPSYLESVLARWTQALASGESFEMTFPLLGTDGTFRPFLTRVMPLKDSEGHVIRWVGTNTDLSAEKMAQQAMIRSEKLAITGKLAASIAHEINNPLEAVTNLLYLLQFNQSLDASGRERLSQAQDELRRVSQIAVQTLRFYRQTTARSLCDVPDLVESVLALFHGKCADSRIGIERQYAPNVSLFCYEGEFRQILTNLIANAVDAMSSGGRLIIRVRKRNQVIHVVVADTGEGIEPALRHRIFEPFFTTKTETGTGLGLWVTQELVHKQGAMIRVKSLRKSKRHGTIFRLSFPCPRAGGREEGTG